MPNPESNYGFGCVWFQFHNQFIAGINKLYQIKEIKFYVQYTYIFYNLIFVGPFLLIFNWQFESPIQILFWYLTLNQWFKFNPSSNSSKFSAMGQVLSLSIKIITFSTLFVVNSLFSNKFLYYSYLKSSQLANR